MWVDLEDGRTPGVPLVWFPRLLGDLFVVLRFGDRLRKRGRADLWLIILATVAAFTLRQPACARNAQVPFVGCKSDGQIGALGPPKDKGAAPALPEPVAARLAWYAGNNTGGVLAPRGWRCFELYGSNGSVLVVAPDGIGRDPFSARLTGPGIQVSVSFGETSGRFEAAKIAARLFPARKAFVASVISEGLEPKSDFVFGPFPHDHIQRLNRDYVAFETPANMEGMGTMSRLVKAGDAIHGLVWMDQDNNATMVVVRLAPGQADLADRIIGAMKPR
jgi:hypothetical protein